MKRIKELIKLNNSTKPIKRTAEKQSTYSLHKRDEESRAVKL